MRRVFGHGHHVGGKGKKELNLTPIARIGATEKAPVTRP